MESLLSTQDVARILGVKYLKAYRLGESGEIPRIRVGGDWKYEPSDIRAYMDRNKSTATAQNEKSLTSAN
jgi:excisionase family DNA binding protein